MEYSELFTTRGGLGCFCLVRGSLTESSHECQITPKKTKHTVNLNYTGKNVNLIGNLVYGRTAKWGLSAIDSASLGAGSEKDTTSFMSLAKGRCLFHIRQAAQEGKSAQALAACRTLSEELTEMQFFLARRRIFQYELLDLPCQIVWLDLSKLTSKNRIPFPFDSQFLLQRDPHSSSITSSLAKAKKTF
ncbi:hypothetical protein E5676_scaffold371G00310 [Cucumis melo var. makuwa]|uniref:Uncharacterized protein n=1 Tax=Cucumis melo var. makuwa TaxID=1194695 RepID=A0A5A7UPV4_CUCMM|nr:hypothetical protein E6C27_scaffold153G00370 [Cucumis melo var. makuwa]TYJ97121.1 hypothetical protein E5676_scaffold371G00310 [Cucumis melo var. makuwa]